MSIDGNYDQGNIFKQILEGRAPAVKVYEDAGHLAFMDIFPESRGHTLVIPKTEARNYLDLPADAIGDYMKVVQKIAAAVHRALDPAGIRIMQYNGAEATQTVFHVHFHIVPCYSGVALSEHAQTAAPAHELEETAALIRAQLK